MKLFYRILFPIVFVGIIVIGTLIIPEWYDSYNTDHHIELGNEIVTCIDDFVAKNDSLPLSLNEIGVKDNGGEIDYKGVTYWYIRYQGGYYLCFQSTWNAGCSIVYNSKEKAWE